MKKLITVFWWATKLGKVCFLTTSHDYIPSYTTWIIYFLTVLIWWQFAELHDSDNFVFCPQIMNIFCRRVTKLIPDGAGAGPLRMSPVTGLARLPGRILLFFHMINFSPVDRDEIQETKPKWWTYTCIVLGFRSFVNSSNFTYKANLHTPKVEIHTRQKLCHFGCYVAKAKLFCLKSFVPFTRAGVFTWENVHLGYRDLVFSTGQHSLSYEHIEIFA